jgi:hypothetical protein
LLDLKAHQRVEGEASGINGTHILSHIEAMLLGVRSSNPSRAQDHRGTQTSTFFDMAATL